jgi:hypothetical protein
MRLYRTDRTVLTRLNSLQTSTDSAAAVLHPPDKTRPFPNPTALYDAYAKRTLLPLPANATELGLAYSRQIGSLAKSVGAAPAAYRGLRTDALDMLIELGSRVRTLSGGAAPLLVDSAVTDGGDQRLLVHDRATLRQPLPGGRVPGDARPPPGAQSDRVGAVHERDRGDRRVRCRARDRRRAVSGSQL